MVSHPTQEGGTFLSPHGRIEEARTTNQRHGRDHCCPTVHRSGEWAVQAMHRYKQTGCQATREELVIYYMNGYVKRVAIRIASGLPRCIDAEDLEQEAYPGLCACIDKYDPKLNSRFEGYCCRRIEGAMRDYLRREDPASRLARARSKAIALGTEKFMTQHGRPPTDEELRARLQLDPAEYTLVMRDIHVPCTVSLHPMDGNDHEDVMAAIHIQQNNPEIDGIERADLYKWLCQHLDTYDQLIVTLYFTENLSMLEIGCVLGYSESRVSQRLKLIIALLRTRIDDYPEVLTLMAS